mmetsp:Transcript_19052/g.55338  ORF Transcript_19052/g.55338 Transcript_19052/m.55338 type:complete len:312 (-) Transcript_19052:97-1032(-)
MAREWARPSVRRSPSLLFGALVEASSLGAAAVAPFSFEASSPFAELLSPPPPCCLSPAALAAAVPAALSLALADLSMEAMSVSPTPDAAPPPKPSRPGLIMGLPALIRGEIEVRLGVRGVRGISRTLVTPPLPAAEPAAGAAAAGPPALSDLIDPPALLELLRPAPALAGLDPPSEAPPAGGVGAVMLCSSLIICCICAAAIASCLCRRCISAMDSDARAASLLSLTLASALTPAPRGDRPSPPLPASGPLPEPFPPSSPSFPTSGGGGRGSPPGPNLDPPLAAEPALAGAPTPALPPATEPAEAGVLLMS